MTQSVTDALTSENQDAVLALQQSFIDGGYDDYSETTVESLLAFFALDANIWLIRCMFPSSRDSSGNVAIGFPRGGFDKGRQHLSHRGLVKLINTAAENHTLPLSTDKWTSLDGINSASPSSTSAIANVVGISAKSIDNAFIAVEFKTNIFTSNFLSDDIVAHIFELDNAYKVLDGNGTLTLILRQSEKLKSAIRKEYGKRSLITFANIKHSDSYINIIIGENAPVSIFGATSNISACKINLPIDDEIGELDSKGLKKLIELSLCSGFQEVESSDTSCLDISPSDIMSMDEFTPQITTIAALVKGVNNLHSRYNVSPYIEIKSVMTKIGIDILSGSIRFVEPNRYVATDASDVYKISDGFRQNTINALFQEIGFIVCVLINLSVPFYDTNFEEIAAELIRIIEPDINQFSTSVFDNATKVYTKLSMKKWSLAYLNHIFIHKYTKSKNNVSYTHNLLNSIVSSLSEILQNFLFADKLTDLNSQSKTLALPTADQAVKLAEATVRSDLDEFVAGIDDIFDIIMVPDDQTSLIDENDFEHARVISELKEQHRIKATQDNWGIFPQNCAEHYKRFLHGQLGASYPSLLSTIASLTSYSGYIQVTADPLDSATFESLVKKEGRVRYEGNAEGNLVLIMQLLTGDSGAGKSYVIRPLLNATRIASVAVTHIDNDTVNFFRNIHLDNGKLKLPKDYAILPGSLSGTHILESEYHDIFNKIRSKDAASILAVNETFTLSDHSAEIAAIRDAMADTELRLLLRSLAHNKLFSGTYNHPIILFFDEASAFMETVYQHSSKITAFCELKSGEAKLFRRAKSNVSGAQIDIQFFGASLHGNLPLPKFLNMAYKADVKDNRAEGVLGRIMMGYIRRNKNGTKPTVITPLTPDRSDEEILSALTTIAHLIPNAIRRLEADYPEDKLSYFSSTRKVTNFYYALDARDQLVNVHERLETKIEGMKTIYPEHSYAYDTYIGKLWEMIYTISGGHKLSRDLFKMAEIVIKNFKCRLFIDGSDVEVSSWDICDYVKDRGVQSTANNTCLLLGVVETLRDLKGSNQLKPIRNRSIKIDSLNAAEVIISHHYDILLHAETMYNDMYGVAEIVKDSARNASAIAVATNNSDSYVAYKIIENLERQIIRCMRSSKILRQSDVIRNMLFQATKKHKDPTTQKKLITQTFANIMLELIEKGYATSEKSGSTWLITGELAQIQPLLTEIKMMMMETI